MFWWDFEDLSHPTLEITNIADRVVWVGPADYDAGLIFPCSLLNLKSLLICRRLTEPNELPLLASAASFPVRPTWAHSGRTFPTESTRVETFRKTAGSCGRKQRLILMDRKQIESIPHGAALSKIFSLTRQV